MTSSVAVVHTGGNKKLQVIIQCLTKTGWVNEKFYDLYGPGSIVYDNNFLLIHDGQRIVIEEYGEFIN